MVAHHLAKVRVASSNLVIRSNGIGRKAGFFRYESQVVGWPRGEATACKAVYTGSNPVSTSNPGSHNAGMIFRKWAIGAAVARFPDTEEVTGSIPVSPTELGNR